MKMQSELNSRARTCPDDPFLGYFREHPVYEPDEKGLLDLPPARRWFKALDWGETEGLYTYQQALDGKSGPRVQLNGREMIMLSSYDYLGLIGHPELESSAISALRDYGTGTGGVRLLTGTNRLHREFEQALAQFKGTEAAITFGSGYMANLAAIGTLITRRDRVLTDACIHRSIVDSLRLTSIDFQTFAHNDMQDLERLLQEDHPGRRTFIIVEGIYSMDGDLCPLPELVALKEKYGALLMIDEAHSIGITGKAGRGVHEHFNLPASVAEVWTASLSKAIPANGGFIAGSRELIIYLQHQAAPYIFSAALTPANIGAAHASLKVLTQEPERLEQLWHNARYLKSGLDALGYNTGATQSPIIPVRLTNSEGAYRMARALFDEGVLVSAVVFPAVAPDQPILRLCATAAQTQPLLDEVLRAFGKVKKQG